MNDFSDKIIPAFRGVPGPEHADKLIVRVGDIARIPKNARLHGERNLFDIATSIGIDGQQTPLVVDRNGFIRKGNGSHEAIETILKWDYVWVTVTELEGARATAYEIRDNATALSSKWDFETLVGNIDEIEDELGDEFDVLTLGFDESEIGPLRAADWQPPSAQEDPQTPPPPPETTPERAPKDPHEDLEEGDRASDDCKIVCTPNQRVQIDRAIERVRILSGELTLTEGRCMELICADYCADPNNDLPPGQQIQED